MGANCYAGQEGSREVPEAPGGVQVGSRKVVGEVVTDEWEVRSFSRDSAMRGRDEGSQSCHAEGEVAVGQAVQPGVHEAAGPGTDIQHTLFFLTLYLI